MEPQLPFVGMAKEMQRLRLAFAAGDPLVLLGPQGSGKTRLIREALSSNHHVLYVAWVPTLHALLTAMARVLIAARHSDLPPQRQTREAADQTSVTPSREPRNAPTWRGHCGQQLVLETANHEPGKTFGTRDAAWVLQLWNGEKLEFRRPTVKTSRRRRQFRSIYPASNRDEDGESAQLGIGEAAGARRHAGREIEVSRTARYVMNIGLETTGRYDDLCPTGFIAPLLNLQRRCKVFRNCWFTNRPPRGRKRPVSKPASESCNSKSDGQSAVERSSKATMYCRESIAGQSPIMLMPDHAAVPGALCCAAFSGAVSARAARSSRSACSSSTPVLLAVRRSKCARYAPA